MIKEYLDEILRNFSSKFKKNEGAYYLLTSKSELQFRDRIAYDMLLRWPNLYPLREHHRHDLTIKNENDETIGHVEFKLTYAADVKQMKKLYKQMHKLEEAEEKIGVLFIPVLIPINETECAKINKYLKYSKMIKKIRKQGKDYVFEEISKNVNSVFKNNSKQLFTIDAIDSKMGHRWGFDVLLKSFILVLKKKNTSDSRRTQNKRQKDD